MNNEQLRSLAIHTGISYDPVTILAGIEHLRSKGYGGCSALIDHAMRSTGLDVAMNYLERLGAQMSAFKSNSGFTIFPFDPSESSPGLTCQLTEYPKEGGAFYFLYMKHQGNSVIHVFGSENAISVHDCLEELRERLDGETVDFSIAHWDDVFPVLLN